MREIVGLFMKLRLVAFGGPAAHLGMIEEEVTFTGLLPAVIGAVAAAILFTLRLTPAWIVLGGAAAGYLAYLV